MNELKRINNIIKRFKISSKPLEIINNNIGLINKSYIIKCQNEDYVLQKINTYVFKKPKNLMFNITLISKHLINKDKRNVKVIETKEDEDYLEINGEYYRCYSYIEDSCSYNTTDNLNILYEFGKTLGLFQYYLKDFDTNLLYETINDFHNTPFRLEQLIKMYKNTDDCKKEVDEIYYYIIRNKDIIVKIVDALNSGEIPFAVVHNDTKLNNCLFNKKTNKGICLIDLDTVMKGSRLFDCGDALRSCASTVPEDDNHYDNVDLDINKFIYFMLGFLNIMKDNLNEKEISLLSDSIIIIALECSIRFLTDYLDNNKYFHIDYPQHNLVRAMNQICLANRVLDRKESLDKIIKSIIKHLENIV